MSSFKAPVNITVGIGLLSAATLLAAWKLYSRKEKIPEKWRKVGTLDDLMCFPIKSCGVIRLNEMECTDLGVRSDWLRDRSFMIVTEAGGCTTARMHPKMVLVKPKVSGHHLVLEAPNMELLKIDLTKDSDPQTKAGIWGQTMDCQDCGDEVANWFSRYLLGEEKGMRLVHCPQDYKKMQKTREAIIDKSDSGAFPDLTSYNLINASSVDDLNTKLTKPITVQQFRPNFTIKGPEPYEEDYWEWVKIGDVVFRAVRQCTRCILTTIDVETGEKDGDKEPITTLNTYRLIGDPKKKNFDAKSCPIMGIHLALRKGGNIKLGDIVEVA